MQPDTHRRLPASKRIALIAHDNKKQDLIDWATHNRELLLRHTLYATGTTGEKIAEALDCEVNSLLSGPLGGDQQIGAHLAEGKIDIVIFFWDPLAAHPHDPDVKALLRLGVVWNVPLACDRATADFMITSPLMEQTYEVQLPNYSE